MSNVIVRTHEWFVASGQMSPEPTLSARQAAFYLGMQFEELGEKLQALNFPAHAELRSLLMWEAIRLKNGKYDDDMAQALADPVVAEACLDADMDVLWVSIGAAYATGCDAAGAYNEVARANWDKFPGGVVTRDPATGKVVKPAGWRAPNLKPYLPGGGAK